MTVKELVNRLKDFHDNDEVTIPHLEFKGVYMDISRVWYSYLDGCVVLDYDN